MRVNYNINAMTTNNILTRNSNELEKVTERLSSGYKINHAKDNPAGLAISRRMNAQIEGLDKANQNSADGVSVVQTAEGALAEIQDMLQRMNELAVQASNGTCTTADRSAIEAEVTQLQEEISRVAKDTEFNSQPLLDGTFDLKAYSDTEGVDVVSYSDEVRTTDYTLTVLSTGYTDANGDYVSPTATLTYSDGSSISGLSYSGDGDVLTFLGDDDFEMSVEIDPSTALGAVTLDVTGIGAMRLQIGSNQDQVLEVRIPEISLENLDIDDLDFSTQESSLDCLEKLQNSISDISVVRSRLGAYENRLEHTVSGLEGVTENLTAAYSRIMDTDMATEMTEYTKLQVLTQAGTSMLAQANERPQQVLQLLQ